MVIFCWPFLRVRNVWDKSCTGYKNTHYTVRSITCFQKSYHLRNNVRKHNTHCCVSSAVLVTRPRNNITLYTHYVSCNDWVEINCYYKQKCAVWHSFFRHVTQCVLVVVYQCFGTAYQSLLQGSNLLFFSLPRPWRQDRREVPKRR
jgi:hypothetical protein